MSRLDRSLLNLAPTGKFENNVEVTQNAPNGPVMVVGELRSERTRLGPLNWCPYAAKCLGLNRLDISLFALLMDLAPTQQYGSRNFSVSLVQGFRPPGFDPERPFFELV